jgi:AcrR family transcriptional regulator
MCTASTINSSTQYGQCPLLGFMINLKKEPSLRSTFRHGDLRQALVDAGIELARAGGPAAVVLREATRQAGVAPNAAYRHYASQQDLLQAVRYACLAALAKAIETELAEIAPHIDPRDLARASLRAIGTGYLNFAQDEPGLFRTAFSVPNDLSALAPEKRGDTGLNPYQLLCGAVDKFVLSGLLPLEQRPGAEFMAWSAVHGLALLITDGPLHAAPREYKNQLGRRVLEMVEKGIA